MKNGRRLREKGTRSPGVGIGGNGTSDGVKNARVSDIKKRW